MNSIKTSDEASKESEFLSALNASLQSFVHKTLKGEQIHVECIHRIACHGGDVLAGLPSEGHTNGCDWWISIRSVDNTQDFR